LSLKRERGAPLASRPPPKVFTRELYLTLQITIIESAASITEIVAGASFTLCSNLYFSGMLLRHLIRPECAECRIKNLQLRTYTRGLRATFTLCIPVFRLYLIPLSCRSVIILVIHLFPPLPALSVLYFVHPYLFIKTIERKRINLHGKWKKRR